MTRFLVVSAMASLVGLAAISCSSDTGDGEAKDGAGSPADTGPVEDTGVVLDGAVPDASDAGALDAGHDAGVPDAGAADAGVDAGGDTGADAGQDAGADAGVDAGGADAGDPSHGTTKGILFTAIKDGETKPDIYLVQPDGSGLLNLSNTAADSEERPCWSGDGASFYFSKAGRVFKTDHPVFAPADQFKGMEPNVSADGSLVAVTRYVDLGGGIFDLEQFIVKTGDGTATQVTSFGDQELENMPQGASFSPDGTKLVFMMLNPDGAYDPFSSDLFVYDVTAGGPAGNFTNQAKTVQAKVANRSPEWSPDGAQLAWFHIGDGLTAYYVTPAGGGTASPVYDASHNGKDGVAWAPDGKALALAFGPGTGIAVVTLDGTVQRELDLSGFTYVDGLSWK